MKALLKTLSHDFNTPDLLLRALTHRSADINHNERLEFLGDAVLNCVIAAELFNKFPYAREGELSRLRSQLVNQDFLAEIAKQFNLGKYLKLGQGELKSGGVRRKSILSDTLEAIIGAVYLDAGFDVCQKILMKWYQPYLNKIQSHKIEMLKDAKSRLQEYCQAKKMPLPLYTVISVTGESHRQKFHVICEIEGMKYRSEGTGASRREAEQIAAGIFLEYFK